MGGKSGGGARTPVIWANTAHSAQRLKVTDLISSGEIFGFQHGNDEPLKSIYLNGTPIQNADGSLNFGGVRAEYNRGTVDQDYMPSFGSVDKAVEVATQVKKDRPISRTVTNSQATSVRVTVGVDVLMWSTLEGDQWPTTAELHVQLVKNNVIHTSKLFSIYEKGNKPYRQDIVFDDLPEAPFEIRCVREMADSNDDMLRNDTYFFSYVESIDAKMRYPLSAVVGLEIDSEQFGDGIPERTYGIKGCIVQVPSNYDPVTRTYTGLWDRLFKPAWTNNPVWILYDLLTDEVDGFNALNKGIKIDIDNFYSVAKYCDELVDDGNGGKEPRFVCNAVFYGEDAYTAINNLCSSFRAVCGYNGEYLTLYTDRAHDVVRIYNNSMVVDGLFDYAETELSQRYNQVQVQWVDAENGYETTIDEVSDDANIALVERVITLSIVAFGVTKLSYARRAALWALITSLTETVVVSFKVGASGIYHEIYDIIEIVDNDHIGTMLGGRIKAINGSVITLDREVNNALEFSIETKSGPRNFDVKRQISETEYELTLAPEIIESAAFNAILKDVEPRLFRCTNIEENDDGTYTVSAIQHNPQKEAIVDRGAEYIPSKTTVINSVPGLSNGIVNNDGRAIILEWDSLSVIGTENTYRIQLFKDKALYKTFETKETSLGLENLPQGEYIAKIRAVNSSGQHSEELVIAFSTTYIIDGLRAKPIVFGIELRWQLPALITSDASTEIWHSERDDRMTATRLAVVPYPQSNYTFNGLSVGDAYYFWFRLVDRAGNDGEFSYSILGKPSDNSDDILSYLDGKISEKEISKELQDQFDKNIDDAIKESEIVINESIGKLELDNEKLNINIEKINADDVLKDISLMNEGYTRRSQDAVLEVNVADAFAQIKETNTVIVDKTEALAQKDTQLEASINSNKAEIKRVEQVVVDEKQSQAIFKEDVKTKFDENEADATLSLISLSTEGFTRSQQDLMLSANVADAHAQIEETKTVVAKEKEAQAEINTDIKSEIAKNSAQIKINAQTQVDDNKALTKQINDARSEMGNNKAEIEGIKVTVADNEKAQAELEEQVTAKFNENEADATLSLISLATEGVTRSQQDLMLKANVGSAQADIEETKGVIAEAKEAQAEINTTLTSKVNNNEAQIKANAQTQATDKATLTQEINSANSKIGKNEAEINKIKTTQVNDQKAISTLKSETSARFDKNEADQILENISLTTEGYSRASQYSVISVSVAGNSSLIEELSNTFADFDGTMSEQITQLQSKTNDHQAQITENKTTTAKVDGKVNALWTLKVDANGAIGGIMLGSDGKESLFKVAADSFIVSTGNQEKNLFIIQRVNGQDVASLNVTDFIIDGSVSAKKFNAESFEGYTITGVEINAGHFYGGSIAIGGTKNKPNFSVEENGDFYAKNGRFEGTILANKIEGNVGEVLNIPAIRYASLLMWGSRTFIKRFDPVPWERNLQVISSWFINQMEGSFHAGNTFRVSEIRNSSRKVLVESSDERIDIYKQGDFIHIPPNVTFSIEIYQSAPTSYTGGFARSNAVKLVDIRSGVVDVEFEVIE
ncbi:phage tail protein [Ignatzschineria rhizosphaerae]|uniref:Phage tail protein n=1 Tax=Ignatzschineria rhizosphaerae TaxID=2923279 RepID=A0ABY3WZC3_9GAMM|nr:phage tail protein [Ignatzschineria rhizosphaerae]UNM95966.1 phage tail protein [Ignatzschineria rhizosphaerae]